jgi:hypothetical protein
MAADQSAVRYFVPDGTRLPRGLRLRLLERQGEIASGFVNGCAKDFADYRFYVGKIQGIKEAIDICDQMEKDEDAR